MHTDGLAIHVCILQMNSNGFGCLHVSRPAVHWANFETCHRCNMRVGMLNGFETCICSLGATCGEILHTQFAWMSANVVSIT